MILLSFILFILSFIIYSYYILNVNMRARAKDDTETKILNMAIDKTTMAIDKTT